MEELILENKNLIYSITRYFEKYSNKEDLFQYEFASVINEEENATMVNMGKLDCGVYTLAGLYPSTYFFERQNISYEDFPQMVDSFEKYIKNKETMFIVYYTWLDEENLKSREEELFVNYDLLEVRKQQFEDKDYYGYLFKVKEQENDFIFSYTSV